VPHLPAEHAARALRHARVLGAQLHELQGREHGGERVAQLVGEHGQELILAAVRFLRFAVEARVVEREPRAPAEVLRHGQVRGHVAPGGRGGHERDGAQRAAARDQGHTHGESSPQLLHEVRAFVRGELPQQQVQRLGAQA
jgi:hypothetical protein